MRIDRVGLRKRAQITLEHESEDRTWVGEFQREDGSNDEELNEWIRSELRAGNPWAWCVAKVTVTYRGLEGTDYLCGCSYESEKAFKEGGYYESMIYDAIEELAKELEVIANEHDIWEHDETTCLFCIVEAA